MDGSLTKTQLSMQYSPDISTAAALKRLNRWMSLNQDLIDALAKTGYVQSQRVFTKAQVELIYDYLGVP